ncbi:MAG: hypothetical protein EP338_10660 [Bacteroidetes bacterium]|nr:MAG: hypothetical protein EP338_10660 [Bacteroidota bacterium]
MKTTKFLIFGASLTLLFACVKHEVVPAPSDLVKLDAHFTGIINGTDVEYTDDVNGFNGDDSQDQIILAPPSLSSAKYYSDISSNLVLNSIKVGIGSNKWDAAALEKPSIGQFNDFCEALKNATVSFSDNAVDGFVVQYKDAFGNVWTSKENSVNSQSVNFTSVETKSDDTGDYALIELDFACHVYRTVSQNPLEIDSLRIDNAYFKGWFKR